MTLRARLTVAFLAVVLGPVLLSAVFAAGTVDAVTRARLSDRLDHGSAAVQTAIMAQCQRLATAAQAVAVLTTAGDHPDLAGRAVDEGMARAVRLENAAGRPLVTTPGTPSQPWASCAGAAPVAPTARAAGRAAGDGPPGMPYTALAARVEVRDSTGKLRGYAYAIEPLDQIFLDRLARAAGVSVSQPPGPPQLGQQELGDQQLGQQSRAVEVTTTQPVPLVVAVPAARVNRLYVVLFAAVVAAGLIAVAVAWGLARTTTEPLVELAGAVERVAGRELGVRVPVRSRDEVGRLAVTFNRMAREMQSYVAALTASRDQLRDNLGVLGDTLSSTHNLDRIFEVILRTALGATSAEAGVVLLADLDTPGQPQLLVGQYGVGLAERGARAAPLDVADIRVRVGEGLLGAVAASREPTRGRFAPELTLADTEPRCRAFVAVPFAGRASGGGRLLGVLALYDRLGRDDFDDTDLATLRTFAGQAAVAVENVLLHDEARRLSVTDPLTGLWNYRQLREELRAEVERAARFDRRLGILVLDLDKFKEVNDKYGHRAGDAVLAEFAQRARAVIREVDLAFRYGGEEFVLLLPETDAAGGVAAAQRLGAAVRNQPFAVPGRRSAGGDEMANMLIPITVSIGIAIYPDHAQTALGALDLADAALYAAKAAGRDTYVLAGAVEPDREVSTSVIGHGGASGGSTPPRQSRGG